MRQKREKERESRGGGAVINNPFGRGGAMTKNDSKPQPFFDLSRLRELVHSLRPRLVFHTTRVVVVSFQTWYAYARKAYLGCQ